MQPIHRSTMALTSASRHNRLAAVNSWQRWRHWILVVRLWFVLFCGLLASAASASTSAATADALVFFGDRNLPPYEYIENDQPKGANVDLVRAIGRVLGRPVEVQLMDWENAQSRLLAGEGHALTFLAPTPRRATQYDFSMPTLPVAFALFVRADNEDAFDPNQLQGKRIGVTKGSFPQQFFKDKQPQAKLVIVEDAIDGTKRLLRGEIDALAANQWSGLYLLKELNISGIVALPPFEERLGSIAVRKGDEVLRSEIDRALHQLQASGEFDEIIDRWSNKKVYLFSEAVIENTKLVAAVAVLALVLLSVALVTLYRKQKEREQILAQMQRQKAFLECVMTHAQACIAVMAGPELRYSFVNPAYQALVPDTPMLGQRYRDIFTNAAREEVEQQLRRVRQSGQPWRIDQFPGAIPGKPEAVWEGQAVLLPTAEDEKSVLVLAWDVTERARAELARQAASQYARSLLEASLDPLVTISSEGTITDVNTATEQVTGVSRETLIGSDFAEYFTDPKMAREGYQMVFSQGSVTDYPLAIRHVSGKVTDVLYNASLYRDKNGNVLGVFAAARDITESKRLGQTLQTRNIDLETATTVAEEANLAKSQFLSSMSHELRTPLNAILGFAQLIESNVSPPTPSQKRSLDQILSAGWFLLELVNEILDLAQIESGKVVLTREAVPLEHIMTECQELVEPLAIKRGISISFPRMEMPHWVDADRTRTRQILINLLHNAIKYNKPGGKVSMACTLVPQNSIRISVRDTGLGLSPEQLSQLFQPFNRLGRESEAEQGTGIGLVVVKRLVELMGGVIGVESQLGVGSVFWIELNLTTAPLLTTSETEQSAQHRPKPMDGTIRRTVLYVEDNPANLALVEELLTRRPDLRLISAADGNLGVEYARTYLPDVILMDIHLPGISGIEAMKVLQADPATVHIPVIALSAQALPADIIEAMKAGFFNYITKPIKLNEFMAALDAALEFSNSKSSDAAVKVLTTG